MNRKESGQGKESRKGNNKEGEEKTQEEEISMTQIGNNKNNEKVH